MSIELRQVSKEFSVGKRRLPVLRNISLKIVEGETLGIIGESGCGKSTLGKIILGLDQASAGTVLFRGVPLSHWPRLELSRQMQMIFQDSSLNPRMRIEDIIGEGIDIHGIAHRRERIVGLLYDVGLDISMMDRYPHELSGGQRQRVGIARALAVDPTFLICDEPLSALDVKTQRQIIELLSKLKKQKSLTYLFISHDLRTVKAFADRVAVMYDGEIIECSPTDRLFLSPTHPYTKALLAAIPASIRAQSRMQGDWNGVNDFGRSKKLDRAGI